MYIEKLTDEQINVLTAYLVADDAKKMKWGFANFVSVDVNSERNRNRIEIYVKYNDKKENEHNLKFVVSDFSCLVFNNYTKDLLYLSNNINEEYFGEIFGKKYKSDFNNYLYEMLYTEIG